MAKKCQIAREVKRAKHIELQAERRAALKKTISSEDTSVEERWEAMLKIQKLKKDGSKIRYTRRCQHTGVSRAVYRKFQLNRITFRKFALEGQLPGVTKASW